MHARRALLLVIGLGTSAACTANSPARGRPPSTARTDASTARSDASVSSPDAMIAVDAAAVPDAGGASSCASKPLVPLGTDTPFMRDISMASGIQDENFVANPPTAIPINDHSRLAFADINGDGFDDIVMHSLYPNPRAGVPFEHLIFVNNGDSTFTNFSDASGLRDVKAGFFVFGDVDNDGDADCFAGLDINDIGGHHQLLLNDGRGHFTVKANSGVASTLLPPVAGNAVFADFDGDANLDLFIGNGHTSFGAPDQLFLGGGDGTFVEVTQTHLTGNPQRSSNGSVACDYDNDGDLDVFVSVYGVSRELGMNVLFENDGTGHFTDVAMARGFAALTTGNYYLPSTGNGTRDEPVAAGQFVGSNGFGLDCADIDNDGDLDVFLTTISHPNASDYRRTWSDPTQVLINQGAAGGWRFVNEFLERNLPFNEGDVDGATVDFDNDGRLDLSISRERKYEGSYTTEAQKSWFGLMHQQPDGTFTSVGVRSGVNDYPDAAQLRMKGAQNHGWSDIDRDGDLDLLVGGRGTSSGRPNFLFENTFGAQNTWLGVELRGDGVAVNRDALGARVSIHYADRTLTREVKSSRGTHSSADGRALLFGLGNLGCAFELVVRWPDGTELTFAADAIGTNRYVTIVYGRGLVTE